MSLLYFVYVQLTIIIRNKDLLIKNNSKLSFIFTFGLILMFYQHLNFTSKIETWMKWWIHYLMLTILTIYKESMESIWMKF